MTTERDELMSRIMFAFCNVDDAYAIDRIEGRYVTKPAVVTTAEELDALPEGTLLLASGTYYGMGEFTDCHCRILPSFIHGEDRTVVEVLIYGGSELAKTIDFPATVLQVGGDR